MSLSKLPWSMSEDKTKILSAPDEALYPKVGQKIASVTALDRDNAEYIVKSVNLMHNLERMGLVGEVSDILQRYGISIE